MYSKLTMSGWYSIHVLVFDLANSNNFLQANNLIHGAVYL